MKKSTKVTLGIVSAAMIVFGGFVYVSFNGVPWKKVAVSQELEKHVENKYNINVEVVDKYYNYKDGSYGAAFKVHRDQEEFTFNSDKAGNGEYLDYYVEELWTSQLKKESYPIIKRSFKSLPIESYDYMFIYGIADELQIKSDNIPDYKKVNSELDLVLRLQDYWSEETKKRGIHETYTLIQELKKQGIDNIGLIIDYKERAEEQEKGHIYRIFFEAGDLKKVHEQEDIEKYLIKE
ncbi:hypothetical protein [Peribacillus sp. Hz7]|uniref:YfjL-like protein n=1 Tax=Peribacillus sp. Hz7 TaxID=3344873 RepID=UPI0035C990DF